MRKRIVALIVLAFAMSLSAGSVTISYEDSKSLPNGTDVTLNLGKFNGNLEDLTNVFVEFTVILSGAQIQMDNDSASSQQATARIMNIVETFSASVRLLKTDYHSISGSNLNINKSQVFNLEPTTGDPVGQFNATNSGDYAHWLVDEISATGSGDIIDFVWADYVGTGDFTVTLNSVFLTSATFTGELGFFEGNTPTGEIYGKVTYEYVPEPATLALLGLGGLFIRRRKV